MSRCYDIFLSHSGAQKDFVEHLNIELARVCGQYSVFFDRDAVEHGEQISTSILEYAGTCKLAVAVLSEEYFTRSRPPMMELAASYAAAKAGIGSPSLPCLLPVFLALHPEDAKDSSAQSRWRKMWQKWEVNEKMSERRKSRLSRVQPTIWKEAVDRLLDTRGPVYIPEEYGYDPEVFMKKVAQVIARRLDDFRAGIDPFKMGDELKPPYEEVCTSGDTSVVEDSCENSSTDSGSGSSRKVTNEKEALPEPYKVLVCLEFGSMYSPFAFSHIRSPQDIYTYYDYPGSGNRLPSCRTETGIYYSSRDGGQSYEVDSWGVNAICRFEREQRVKKSNENFLGIYVTRFNPHLKVRDTQISTTKRLKLPYSLPVDRPITDYLHEFGAFILQRLQQIYGEDLSMKMIQWCVPVPSSWDNAAQEKMKTCMESAGLINGADGSPYPVKMVGELEAASLWCLRRNELQFLAGKIGDKLQDLPRKVGDKVLVVDIGESFFDVVVQEVVFVRDYYSYGLKEVSSRLFIRYSYPEREFLRLLQCKIGPGLQDFQNEYPTISRYLFDQWDRLKYEFGDAEGIGEPIEISFPTKLTDILERYEQTACSICNKPWTAEESDPLRNEDVHGEEILVWNQKPSMLTKQRAEYERREELEIPYDEFRSLFDPAIEELISCIHWTYSAVGGVRSLVLVGDWLAHSSYVMKNISQRFPKQLLEIIKPRPPHGAVCLGAVVLGQEPEIFGKIELYKR